MSVTPGIPPPADTKTDTRLTGKNTPVNDDVRFTAVSAAMPISIEITDLLTGCLFPAIRWITENTKIVAAIINRNSHIGIKTSPKQNKPPDIHPTVYYYAVKIKYITLMLL